MLWFSGHCQHRRTYDAFTVTKETVVSFARCPEYYVCFEIEVYPIQGTVVTLRTPQLSDNRKK